MSSELENTSSTASTESRRTHGPSIKLPLALVVFAALGNVVAVAMWVGAVWLGALLAYREIAKWRS